MSIVASLVAAQRAQDLHAICDAIDAVVTALRRHELTEEEMDAGGECLLALAESRRWEVRRSVAAALRHVRGGAVDSTLRRLRADEVARVKQAAEESIQRRAERKQLDLLPILGDEELERLLAAADKKSPHGRRAALRAGTAYAQFIVRGQNHEVARAITQANTSLMILEQSLDGPARERVRGFREKLRHINAIHDDARIYVMNERPEYTPQDVQAHVDETIAFARGLPIAQANGLEAQVDVEPGLKVDGEYDLVRRAFDNVVKNAVEASEGTRPVQLTVTAHSVQGTAEIAFRDHGCGMTPEAVRELFRPYRSKKTGGTGLGMPLVKKIVEIDHQGRVDVRSAVGVGTTVTLALPIRQDPAR